MRAQRASGHALCVRSHCGAPPVPAPQKSPAARSAAAWHVCVSWHQPQSGRAAQGVQDESEEQAGGHVAWAPYPPPPPMAENERWYQ
jgi:hypothetical protein